MSTNSPESRAPFGRAPEVTTLYERLCRIQEPKGYFFNNDLEIIAVRLRPNKKVQNLNEMWYEDVVQTHTTQGDFGLESP